MTRPTAAANRYTDRIRRLHCVIHWFGYRQARDADAAHNVEFERGQHSDFATVPLCAACRSELRESRRHAFYAAHKLTDVKLLAWANQLMAGAELPRNAP